MASITILVTVAVSDEGRKPTLRALAPRIQLTLSSTVNRIIGTTLLELLIGTKPRIPGMVTISTDLDRPARSDVPTLRAQATENIEKSARYEKQRS